MSYAVETAPPARCRSAEARRAARQVKASREKRIVEFLNRGVSVAEIAEREGVSENRMLVRDILARRMPAPPSQCGEADDAVIAGLVKRIRGTPPQRIEKFESAGVARKPSAPKIRRPSARAPSRLLSSRPARRRPARKLPRKGLKRLIPGSEIVWPRKPRTHKM